VPAPTRCAEILWAPGVAGVALDHAADLPADPAAGEARVFLWVSFPILLTGFDAFRNGQANTIFAR